MKPFSDWTRYAVRCFAVNQSGAVTVDWVALTAALCAMVLMVFTIVTEAVIEDTAMVIADRVDAAANIEGW